MLRLESMVAPRILILSESRITESAILAETEVGKDRVLTVEIT